MTGRGALIVMEGIDRSGKSTQCKMLVNALSKAKSMKFPDRTTATGNKIDQYLQRKLELDDNEIHNLYSKNRWEKEKAMLDDLEKGITLVVDRYAYSGVAYTGAKPGFDLDKCKEPDVGLPQPDLVFFLDLKVNTAANREAFGGERYEQTDFQKKVYANFLKLKSKEWQVIDASRSIEEVNHDILNSVNNILGKVEKKPIGKLWAKNKI
uniref:Thymidylate kinase n=1 Tax=Phallusia mammillata TaxID=59560 RepID=A0A6F9DC63_9ASCI|nr:thymidylate kinase-like [Phallusia mammillata]